MILADEHGLSALLRITNECRRVFPDLDQDKEQHGAAELVTEMATELAALRQWKAEVVSLSQRVSRAGMRLGNLLNGDDDLLMAFAPPGFLEGGQ